MRRAFTLPTMLCNSLIIPTGLATFDHQQLEEDEGIETGAVSGGAEADKQSSSSPLQKQPSRRQGATGESPLAVGACRAARGSGGGDGPRHCKFAATSGGEPGARQDQANFCAALDNSSAKLRLGSTLISNVNSLACLATPVRRGQNLNSLGIAANALGNGVSFGQQQQQQLQNAQFKTMKNVNSMPGEFEL